MDLSAEQRNWIQRHRTLRIAVDPDFAPYEFVDERGRHRGISADYLGLLGQKLGLRFTLVPTADWDELLRKGFDKQVDVLPLINRTPKRGPHLLFTDPYIVSQRVIITRGRLGDIHGEADLPDSKLVLPAGYSINEHIRERFPAANIVEVSDIPKALQRVSVGEADATILS